MGSGQTRWILDFRQVNSLSVTDSFPTPNISDILGSLGKSTYFSTLDPGRKSEAIVIPGRTFVMEFEVGFQTASNSEIKCQGQDILLDGSIEKGIVQHVEYIITIEHELFLVTGDTIMAMSSAKCL